MVVAEGIAGLLQEMGNSAEWAFCGSTKHSQARSVNTPRPLMPLWRSHFNGMFMQLQPRAACINGELQQQDHRRKNSQLLP